jgi:RNA polymerase sigma factor (sigma-70 family)
LAAQLAPAERDACRREAWVLLVTSLARYLQQHSQKLGWLGQEEIEDLASQKSLDLMRRCESGSWRVDGHGSREMAAFLSTVARNGVIDRLRHSGPRRIDRHVPLESLEESGRGAGTNGAAPSDPARAYEALEFGSRLAQCVRCLPPRARKVWFLKVCLEWPSRRVANHPEVRMNPAHVDVEFHRARKRVRASMQSAGFQNVEEIPPGAFTEVWRLLNDPLESDERVTGESQEMDTPS